MVAEDGIHAVAGFQARKRVYERLHLLRFPVYDIAGEENYIRIERVYLVDKFCHKGGVGAESAGMKVGELHHPVAGEAFRQVGDFNLYLAHINAIAVQQGAPPHTGESDRSEHYSGYGKHP